MTTPRNWDELEVLMESSRKKTGIIDYGRTVILDYLKARNKDEIKVGDAERLIKACMAADGKELKISNSVVRSMAKKDVLELKKVKGEVVLRKVTQAITKKK